MNKLSWLLYSADLFSSLAIVLALSVLITLIIVMCIFIAASELLDNDDEKPKAYKKARNFLWVPALCGLVWALLPSKDTMYAIAASEIGEDIITEVKGSEVYNKANAALNAWLDRQLDNKPK